MSFIVEDFHDLARILRERPEWREELRRQVLTEELLALPEQIVRLSTITDLRFQELTEAQKRTEDRLTELAAAQQRTEEHFSELAAAYKHIEGRFTDLADSVRILARDMGDVKGKLLVVEVSWGVGPDDASRAVQRAAFLTHLGVQTIPVVAGTWVTPEAEGLARRSQAWQITNGHAIPPEPRSAAQ